MKDSLKKRIDRLRIKNFLVLAIAGFINAFGITVFLSPVKLYDSGISGTSMLLSQLTPDYLNLSFFLVVLNVPLFLYGLKKQGVTFTIYSLFTVCMYSFGAWLITDVLPIDVSLASPLAGTDLLLCALFGGNIAHRRKAVCPMRSHLLYRVFADHIQFLRHLVAVIGEEIVIKRFHVTCYTTANARGMSREDGTNLRQLIVDIQSAKTAHPLVGVIDHLLRAIKIVVVETLYHQGSSIREHRSLVVVTIGMKTVYAVVLPQPTIYLILFLKIRIKVH